MKSKEYRAILGRLPIENPTPEDMAMLCPHLRKAEAVAAFAKDSGFVACPSLRIRNGFQIVHYRDRIKAKGHKTLPPTLEWTYAGRTMESYVKRTKEKPTRYQHSSEAIQFANENWGDELILDSWTDIVEFNIDDPSDLHKNKHFMLDGGPKTKAVVGVCINKPWNDLINEHHKPTSVLIDEAIVEMALDKVVWYELRGDRGGYTEFNCAYCGSGLGLGGCSGCGHRFRDSQMRSGWNTPLPKKIVQLLRDTGHVFKKDPEIAWQLEAERHQEIKRQVAFNRRRMKELATD